MTQETLPLPPACQRTLHLGFTWRLISSPFLDNDFPLQFPGGSCWNDLPGIKQVGWFWIGGLKSFFFYPSSPISSLTWVSSFMQKPLLVCVWKNSELRECLLSRVRWAGWCSGGEREPSISSEDECSHCPGQGRETSHFLPSAIPKSNSATASKALS